MSTFSTRRAERVARGWTDDLPPRLVSCGIHERAIEAFGTKGSRRYSPSRRVRVEMLVDVKHPKHTYAREEGSVPVRIDQTRSEPPAKGDVGIIRRRAELSGYFPAGKSNEVLSKLVILRSPAGDQVRPVDGT